MAVTQYLYNDASAPVLTGSAGSMIALLDKVLVDGYGAKAGLGWTKAFSGSNVAVYRNNPSAPGSTGMYLRVDDTNSQYCIVRAYKTMTDANTGTDVIPSGTPGWANTQVFWSKSATTSATVNMWQVIGDDRTFYMNMTPNTTFVNYAYIYGAGDFDSYVPGNAYNYFITGSYDGGYSSQGSTLLTIGGSYSVCLIGRSQELTTGKQARAWVSNFASQYGSGSNSHQPFSVYTGMRFYYPAYLVEDSTQVNLSGKFRGVYGLAGRATFTWNENVGKLPSDPSGPDMIQFYASGDGGAGMFVQLGNW